MTRNWWHAAKICRWSTWQRFTSVTRWAWSFRLARPFARWLISKAIRLGTRDLSARHTSGYLRCSIMRTCLPPMCTASRLALHRWRRCSRTRLTRSWAIPITSRCSCARRVYRSVLSTSLITSHSSRMGLLPPRARCKTSLAWCVALCKQRLWAWKMW